MNAHELHDAAAFLAERIPEHEVEDDLVAAADMETRWLLTLAAMKGSRELDELAVRLMALDPDDMRLQAVCSLMRATRPRPYVTAGLLAAMAVVLVGFAWGMAETSEQILEYEASLVAIR